MPTFNNTSTGYTGTIQSWTCTASGIYKIEAYGAAAGNAPSGTTGTGQGAPGAYMSGLFNLVAGDVLDILVGQRGTGNQYESGGGGGSFVVKHAGNVPLLVAGGGGGSSYYGKGSAGNTTTSGGAGLNGGSAGGTSGAGGSAAGSNGSGGGGFTGDGIGGGWSAGCPQPGLSYTHGGNGGANGANAGVPSGAYGGFGGGGSTHGNWLAGPGGGGYSGGGSGTSGYGGGGGGSYNAGTSQVNTAGANNGQGSVIITLMSSPPAGTSDACTNLRVFSATLNGTVTGTGTDATYNRYFEYGTTTSYGTTIDMGVSGSTGSFNYTIPGLTPNTTYHYRVKLVNTVGTSYGNDQTFTTKTGQIMVSTSPATSITSTAVTQNGSIVSFDE